MQLKNLKFQDLQTSVQEQIKMYIVESNMKNGDILPPEKEFAEKFGISRTAVREALRSLETLGIIEVRHGVGRFVREFNFEAILNNLPYSLEFNLTDFQDIMEVRLCLESYFLAKDMTRFTATDYADLDALFQKLEQQVHDHSEEQELIETHVQFHCALYRHSNNQLLLNLIQIFATIQRKLTLLHRYKTSDRQQFIEQHRLLLDALRQQNTNLVQQQIHEHFTEARQWARQLQEKSNIEESKL